MESELSIRRIAEEVNEAAAGLVPKARRQDQEESTRGFVLREFRRGFDEFQVEEPGEYLLPLRGGDREEVGHFDAGPQP